MNKKQTSVPADIFAIFSKQTEEMCKGLDDFLAKETKPEEEDLYEAYRLVHRCKGDALQLSLNAIADIASRMVHPLQCACNQRRPLTYMERSDLSDRLNTLRAHC
jgi:chemotaxis protein histidine kinase CheA